MAKPMRTMRYMSEFSNHSANGLAAMTESILIIGESGNQVGVFIPIARYRQLLRQVDQIAKGGTQDAR